MQLMAESKLVLMDYGELFAVTTGTMRMHL